MSITIALARLLCYCSYALSSVMPAFCALTNTALNQLLQTTDECDYSKCACILFTR